MVKNDMTIDARIALLKKILVISQSTMKTVQTTPSVSIPQTAPVAQPQKTPVIPLQNATPPVQQVQPTQSGQPTQPGQPQPNPAAKPQTTVPVQTINPATTTQPQPAGVPGQPKSASDKFGDPIESEQIYNIVKSALNEKTNMFLRAWSYYKNPEIKDKILQLITNKGVAVSNIDGETFSPHVIKGEDDYDKYIKNGAISIFEPVNLTTKSFRIYFNSPNKNMLLGTIKLAKDKFEQLGFASDVIKSNGEYQLKCVSTNEMDTNALYFIASEMLSVVGADLRDLRVGNLKRSVYSLDKFANQDTIIDL
jgi:hypothetical protein